MSELTTYITLGFRHITDPNGADHILFLLVLAAIYRLRDWRGILGVVTAFTVGHSVTLALAVTGWLRLQTALIEFLIPVTIVLTALENITVADAGAGSIRRRYRPVFAAIFGLVHGAGFANYLQSLFMERIVVPLFGFNVGIELGQIVVLTIAFTCFVAMDRVLGWARRATWTVNTLRLRTVMVSGIVAIIAAEWVVERIPW